MHQGIELFGFHVLDQPEDTVDAPDGYESPLFNWDLKKASSKLRLDSENLICQSLKGNGFKSVLGSCIFSRGGKYYFEVFINKGHFFKIGVCRPNCEFQVGFSDSDQGWAIFNGYLRHNSASSGKKYGKQLKQGDIVGVALDMQQGSLTFFVNGECWGEAFRDPKLSQGQLVAAVASMHSDDIFTLRTNLRED